MTSPSRRRSVEGHLSDMSDAYEGNECGLDIPLSTQCRTLPWIFSLQFWCGQALPTFSLENLFNSFYSTCACVYYLPKNVLSGNYMA